MSQEIITRWSKDNVGSKDNIWSKDRIWPKHNGKTFALGWMRDHPSIYDYNLHFNDPIKPKHKALGQKKSTKEMVSSVVAKQTQKTPVKIDLIQWCSPIENQGEVGSCTAHAGVALIEYFERRAFGNHIDASRLFLYKASRNLLGWTGDTGAYIRSTMQAMVLFGVPPEEYWPYTDASPYYDEEPTAFCYAFAQNYQALKYYRLDPLGTQYNDLLETIKNFIAHGLPVMFGFSLFTSFIQSDSANTPGEIPFPSERENLVGGHAVVAIGYYDNKEIVNIIDNNKTTGALLIRNSWGTEWGEKGYGWLPYDYILSGLTSDWWSLIKQEWVDSKQFGLEKINST